MFSTWRSITLNITLQNVDLTLKRRHLNALKNLEKTLEWKNITCSKFIVMLSFHRNFYRDSSKRKLRLELEKKIVNFFHNFTSIAKLLISSF